MDQKTTIIGVVIAVVLIGLAWFALTILEPENRERLLNTKELPPENPVGQSNLDTTTRLSGTWRSTDDPRFLRTFSANGTITDSYEDDQADPVSGTWSFADEPSERPATLPVVKDAKVIKVQFPEEVMYFAITGLDENELQMIYLGTNKTLTFTRRD